MSDGPEAHLEFSPPPTPGLMPGVALALVAHGLLLALLSFAAYWAPGVPPIITVQAELWPSLAPAPSTQTTTPSTVIPPSAMPTLEAGIGLVQDESLMQHQMQLQQQKLEKEEKRRQALRKLKDDMDRRDMNEGEDRPRDPT